MLLMLLLSLLTLVIFSTVIGPQIKNYLIFLVALILGGTGFSFVLTMISAIAEFERSLIVERVRAGIAKSQAQGKRHGRPKIDEETAKQIRKLRKQKKSLRQIAKQVGVSRQTIANYL